MAKIHDLFIVELAEVIKGYGNNPDVNDPFRLSEFYRFYELPNIAVSRKNFEKMRPIEERKTGKWIHGREVSREMIGDAVTAIFYEGWQCSECKCLVEDEREPLWKFCPNCGAKMEEGEQE